MYDNLTVAREDAYPTVAAYLRWRAALETPQASVARFSSQVRYFFGNHNRLGYVKRSDLVAVIVALKEDLVSVKSHRAWRKMQDDMLSVMEAALKGDAEKVVFSPAVLKALDQIASRRSVVGWFGGKDYKNFMTKVKHLASASDAAISTVRVRRYRSEMKPGVRVFGARTYSANEIVLTVKSVKGDKMKLSDGSMAIFKIQRSERRSYGEWVIASGNWKGVTIRKLLALDEEIAAAGKGLWTVDKGIEEARPWEIVDPNFRTDNAEPEETEFDQAKGGTMRLGPVAESVMPEVDIAGIPRTSYGALATYLIRRFGYPTHGSDDHKDIMGSWFLSTPEPGLFLSVCPSASGARHSFSYALTNAASREMAEAVDAWCSHVRTRSNDAEVAARYCTILGKYYRAARVAIADLMRPVPVRDQWLTARGLFDTESGKFSENGLEGVARRSETCNYGVDHEMLENYDETTALIETARHFGPTYKTAMIAANRVLKARGCP